MAFLDVGVAALAMVLVVSGVLKIRDPDATTPMLEAVGLPASRPAVYVVAIAEVATGVGSLVIGGVAITAVMALLYAGFAVIGAVLVRSGAGVPCGCFGRRSSSMTPLHVGVDAAAGAVALAAALTAAPGLYTSGEDRPLAVLAVATVGAGLLAAAVVALLTVVPDRRSGPAAAPVRARASGPGAPSSGAGSAPVGAPGLHVVEGVTPAGDPVLVEVAGSGRVVLLAFLTTTCGTCARFWQTFRDLAPADLPGDRTDLVIVTRGDDQEDPGRVRELAPSHHLVVRSTAAWRDYGVVTGPYFVLLDGRRDRVLGDGAASTWEEVAGLLRRAVRSAPPTGVAE